MKNLIAITISIAITLSGLCALPLDAHADSMDMPQKECCYEKHEMTDEVRAIIVSTQIKTVDAIVPKEFSVNFNQEHQNKFKETTSNSPPKNLLTGTTIKLE